MVTEEGKDSNEGKEEAILRIYGETCVNRRGLNFLAPILNDHLRKRLAGYLDPGEFQELCNRWAKDAEQSPEFGMRGKRLIDLLDAL